jgi:hypothetical protein
MYEYCICIILMAVSTHAFNALSEDNFKFTQFLAIFFFSRTPFWIRLIYLCALLDRHDLKRDFNLYVILCCKGLN